MVWWTTRRPIVAIKWWQQKAKKYCDKKPSVKVAPSTLAAFLSTVNFHASVTYLHFLIQVPLSKFTSLFPNCAVTFQWIDRNRSHKQKNIFIMWLRTFIYELWTRPRKSSDKPACQISTCKVISFTERQTHKQTGPIALPVPLNYSVS